MLALAHLNPAEAANTAAAEDIKASVTAAPYERPAGVRWALSRATTTTTKQFRDLKRGGASWWQRGAIALRWEREGEAEVRAEVGGGSTVSSLSTKEWNSRRETI